jgi:hypothetical protein
MIRNEEKLYDRYISWLEENYSGPQIDDGDCLSFDDWFEDLKDSIFGCYDRQDLEEIYT